MEQNNEDMVGVLLGGAAVLAALACFFLKFKKEKATTGKEKPNEATDTTPQNMDFSKVDLSNLPSDAKDTVSMSDVVAYFKSLLGKIKHERDTPFIAKGDTLVKMLKDCELKIPENVLFLGTLNNETEEIENPLLLEYKTLDNALAESLSKSENGIITLS